MLHDLSIVIICYNEEKNLPRLLKSIPSESELIVVDSFSQDKSVEIAKSYNAQMHERAFDNFAAQKNFAIAQASRKWTLVLDADEQLTLPLIDSLRNVLSSDYDSMNTAYAIPRKLVFMNKKMRYGKTADKPIRLFKTGKAVFKGDIHEVLQVDDQRQISKLSGSLLHYSYSDISDYFERFNRYTSMIAQNHFKSGKPVNFLSHILRPWVEFISRYIFRFGFLDGYEGYVYALFSSLYTFTKYAKYYELLRDDEK